MEDLISVIVPIYNVEDYLIRCINSILAQTHYNLDIILINDGSTDHSPTICDEFSQNDSRIRVVHQKNHGLSYSRNIGIELAKGDYVAFIDSDDYISPYMFEILYKVILETNSDIVIANFERVTSIETRIENSFPNYKTNSIVDGLQALENLYNDLYETTVVPWNKLIRKQLFAELRFTENVSHEDEFIIHHLLNRADKVVYCNTTLYYYQIRQNSIMGCKHNLKGIDKINALEDRLLFAQTHNYEKIYYLTLLRYLYQLVHKYYSIKLYNKNVNDALTILANKFALAYNYKKQLSYLHKKFNLQSDHYFIIQFLIHIHFLILKLFRKI